MSTVNDKANKLARAKVRAYLQQCYRDSLPDLDKSIPLGVPTVEKFQQVQAYYRRTHERCGPSKYRLHHVQGHGFATGMRNVQRPLRKANENE